MRLIKSGLIAKLAARYPQLEFRDAEESVVIILSAMSSTLVNGKRIEIRGFGSFRINRRPSRTSRNPKTGEKVAVPEKYAPHFKPGRELRERVDK